MAPIDEAIAFLRSSRSGNISEASRKYNVNRSTLSRRFHGKTRSTAKGYHMQQLLTHKQELMLVKQINKLSEWCLPPTPSMVRAWAATLCGTEPSKNWCAAFRVRHKDELDCRYLNTIDLERHRADSESSYRQYFAILEQKIIEYNIQPHNCYNMDEKGFLIGHLQKAKRIFPKALMKTHKLLGTGQDGARHWITLLATICADGSSLPPALIYKAVSGNLQDTWLQDYEPEEHPCWFASSPNGWTSDELGLSWLQSLFDPQTSDKAKRDWRLLILDGHGSHCTLAFLEWCHKCRILVAVYPPHSTHRLQPLDVSLFRPLATYYSQALDAYTRQSLGLSSVSKRDFFAIFYPAFDKAFTEENIRSAWRKTGIEPWDPAEVLQIFDKEECEGSDSSQASAPSDSLRSSCLDSPRATRKIRRIVSQGVRADDARKDKTIRLLGDAYLGASARAKLAEEREQGLLQSINAEKNKRKRGRAFTEQLRAEEGLGVLFFSPSKVVKARDLAAAQESAKDNEDLDRLLRAQDRAQLKTDKELESRQKREDRAMRAVARKTKEALDKAQRQRDKLAKKAQKQLQTESQASQRRPGGRLPKQKQPQEPVMVVIEPEVAMVPEQPMSRTGRAIKRPRRFDYI
jgi:hypothetical protein